MKINIKRFNKYHYEIGEDFIDQTGLVDFKIFGGWLLHKYPEKSEIILSILEDKFNGDSFCYEDIYDSPDSYDLLYTDISEFANQIPSLSIKINKEFAKYGF